MQNKLLRTHVRTSYVKQNRMEQSDPCVICSACVISVQGLFDISWLSDFLKRSIVQRNTNGKGFGAYHRSVKNTHILTLYISCSNLLYIGIISLYIVSHVI